MDKNVIYILTFILFTSTSSAASINPIDAGAQMISNGLDSWAVNLGDKFMNASNLNNQSDTDRVIFSILTFTYDPFKNPWVLESRNTTAMIYTILVFLFMLSGAAYIYLHTASPTVARNIDWLAGGNIKHFHLNNYIKNLVLTIIFAIIVYTGYWMLLVFNEVLSEMILSYTLDSIIPKPDNFVMYIIMAFAAFMLSIFMAWRNLVIGWGAAYILIIAGMYLLHSLKEIAVKIFMYILIMIFMQVILLSFAGAGVMIIQWIPLPEIAKSIYYTALVTGLFLTSIVLVIGSSIFIFFMRSGSKVIKLVV